MKIFTNASMLKMMIIGLCLTTSACGGYKLELPIVSGAPSEEEPTQGNATKEVELTPMREEDSTPWTNNGPTTSEISDFDSTKDTTDVAEVLLHTGYAKALVKTILRGFSTINQIVSSSEESGLYDLVAAGAWYEATLKYSNPTRCNRYFKNISWSRLGVCISGYAASAMLMYMGYEQSPLLCLGHQAADCNSSLFGYGGGGIICMASLGYSVYTACLNYGCCRPSGRAERVEDAGLQKYCYIMSAICAEWSAYSAPRSLNDHYTTRLDLSDNVYCFRWKEACARLQRVVELETNDIKKAIYEERVSLMKGMILWCKRGDTDHLKQAAATYLQLADSEYTSEPERVLDAYRAILIASSIQGYCIQTHLEVPTENCEVCSWCQQCVAQGCEIGESHGYRIPDILRHRIKILQRRCCWLTNRHCVMH